MKSEEIKAQERNAYGGASISKEGLEQIVRGLKKDKLEAWEQLQRDIVGFLFELPDLLESPTSRTQSRGQKEIFEKLTDYVNGHVQTFEKKDTILCLANDYGIVSEEFGFRNGFAMAMKLCMQGMSGGACA